MSKNLVVCLDGTGNEFSDRNSNIVKLCQILKRDPAKQVVYYNPGIGTNPELYMPTIYGRIKHKINKLWDQATGRGIVKNASDAYIFLMNNCDPDDQIYIFGFSRGAYTARVLGAMIYRFGLLDRGNDNLVKYAATLLLNKNPKNDLLASGFSQTFGRDCPIHFLGVWDTVSSVRWFADPPYVQHTNTNPCIKAIRHAVAIDERRAYFRTNLFGLSNKHQNLKEVWFPGVHADIGGGYPENESSLSKISLEWMLREAEAYGLIADHSDKERILGNGDRHEPPLALSLMHNEMHAASNLFGLAELIPKRRWDNETKKYKITLPLGKSRYISNGSKIHESVFTRLNSPDLKYQPKNIPESYEVEK